MSISRSKAAQWLGRPVCVHWKEPDGSAGAMSGEGWQMIENPDDEIWFYVDFGYGVPLAVVSSMHSPEEPCPTTT